MTAPAPASYRDEPWFTLWSSLCHQGDVYSASLAAVPDLVALARSRGGLAGLECLYLAASIELERHAPHGPDLPSELRLAYQRAVVDGLVLAREYEQQLTGDPQTRAKIAAAAFSGQADLARKLYDENE